jgi:hypothetical protein
VEREDEGQRAVETSCRGGQGSTRAVAPIGRQARLLGESYGLLLAMKNIPFITALSCYAKLRDNKFSKICRLKKFFFMRFLLRKTFLVIAIFLADTNTHMCCLSPARARAHTHTHTHTQRRVHEHIRF